MKDKFNFSDLFVLDLANNHQGDIQHGSNIIHSMASMIHKHNVRAGIKFQFRQLDSFIHASHKEQTDNKHIPRFLSTRLDPAQFQVLLDAVHQEGLLSICTPFDEESVDVICNMGFDIIKVASCSAKDWPLLEKIANASLPVIFSTGGLSIKNIDDVVSFFEHRGVDFAIMHCVSIYPTPFAQCQLNQIETLRQRYPGRTIGWSTHEEPRQTAPVQVAVAKGAQMFERHVGVVTDKIKLNAYSSTPKQIDAWITAYKEAKELCGELERPASSTLETSSIDSLRRGVYVRQAIKVGMVIKREQVYFAMPYVEGQLESGQWKNGIVSHVNAIVDQPLKAAELNISQNSEISVIKSAIHEIKAMLHGARIALNSDFKVEFSHHYGIDNFRKIGAILIDCINREYCKKLLIILPGQNHPDHFHKRKEETFQVLSGVLQVNIDGFERVLQAGETCLVLPGVWHSFSSETGCIFEEISTTHYNDDSFYKDKQINKMARSERKTIVDHWGRFQMEQAEQITESLQVED